jgi:hypothetical protein
MLHMTQQLRNSVSRGYVYTTLLGNSTTQSIKLRFQELLCDSGILPIILGNILPIPIKFDAKLIEQGLRRL